MPIVFAAATSHAPGITAWPEAAPVSQRERIFSAFQLLKDRMSASTPDIIFTITVEHWANFFLNNIPPFCLGRANHFIGPVEPWLNIPKKKVPGDPAVATYVLEEFYKASIDISFSDELAFDHATLLPLHLLAPDGNIPVIPLIVNALTPPMPTPRRCFEVGEILGRILAAQPKRVAVLATGGLSHWPGEPRAGEINIEFDEMFLKCLTSGQTNRLATFTDEEIARAGSGAHEIRTWIALAGALPGWLAEIHAYEPVIPWATGCGLVSFRDK